MTCEWVNSIWKINSFVMSVILQIDDKIGRGGVCVCACVLVCSPVFVFLSECLFLCPEAHLHK